MRFTTNFLSSSGFVLLVTLFTLLSISMVVVVLMQSLIGTSKMLSLQQQRLNEQQILQGLQAKSRAFIAQTSTLDKLNILNNESRVLSSTAQADFNELLNCGGWQQGSIWQPIDLSPLHSSHTTVSSYYALLSTKQTLAQDEKQSLDNIQLDSDFYLLLFKHCVLSQSQSYWRSRYHLYKVFDPVKAVAVESYNVSSGDLSVELLN